MAHRATILRFLHSGEKVLNMINLHGKVAIVTGAAQGIGAASARTLAEQGARVVISDINGDGARQHAESLVAKGFDALAITTDVRVEQQVRSLVAETVAHYGRLDILHNNAAAMDLANQDFGVVDLPLEVWEGTLATNVRGAFLGCKHAVPVLVETGGGSIVNTSSVSGATGDMIMTAYGASKAALSQLTRAVATQWGKQGIRCNAVAPGLVLTPSSVLLPEEVKDLYLRHSLTPYLGQPEDVANLVAFLASDDARYLTGQVISLDGGLTAHHPILAEYVDWAASL